MESDKDALLAGLADGLAQEGVGVVAPVLQQALELLRDRIGRCRIAFPP